MGKWTPGPWHIGTETRGYEICTIHHVPTQPTEDGLGQQWVYIYPERIIDGEWYWADAETQIANARLISLAPEMAEALRLLVADVADYPAWQRPCHALDVARAILSKLESDQ